jgi:AraC family transcriptional activator of pobA
MKKRTVPVYGIDDFTERMPEHSFYSNILSRHLESHQFINHPHKHNTYIVVLFVKGTGEHQVDFDTFAVKPGSVFMLNPGQVHCWKLSKDAEGYIFFHTKEFYDTIFLQRKIDSFPFFYLQQNYPALYLKKENLSKITTFFAQINEEHIAQKKQFMEKIGSLIDILYIELTHLYIDWEETHVALDSNYAKVKKLQKLIDENYKVRKFPKDYAEMLNVSTRHLSRICQETLNKSTSQLIAERIITEAKRMLIYSDVTIYTVADELGYDDYSYFIRLFKTRTGLSPKEFQQRMKLPLSGS